MSSDGNSSGVGSVDGGTGVPFSNALRRRPFGVLRATVFRPPVLRGAVRRVAILRPAAVFRTAVLRVADLRPVVFRAAVLRTVVWRPPALRAADLRVMVFRAAVLRAAVLRPAVLRAPVLRPMVFRAAVLRAPVLRAPVLRVAALRRVVRRAPVLRGRPGLRLLAINPSVCSSAMCADGYRISYHANRPPLAVFRGERRTGFAYANFSVAHSYAPGKRSSSGKMRRPFRIKAADAMFVVREDKTAE